MERSPEDPPEDLKSSATEPHTTPPATFTLEPLPTETAAAHMSVESLDRPPITPLTMSTTTDPTPPKKPPAIDVDVKVPPAPAPGIKIDPQPSTTELEANPNEEPNPVNVKSSDKELGPTWFDALLLAIRSGVLLYINVRVHADELQREHDDSKLINAKARCEQVHADYLARLNKIDTQLEMDPETKSDTALQTEVAQTAEALLEQIKADRDAGIITEEQATQQIEQLDAALKGVPEALKTGVACAVTDAKQAPPTIDAPKPPIPTPSPLTAPKPTPPGAASAETAPIAPTPTNRSGPTPTHQTPPASSQPTSVPTSPVPAPVPTLLSPAAPQPLTSLPLDSLSQSQEALTTFRKNPIAPETPQSFDPAHTGPIPPPPLVPQDEQTIKAMPALSSLLPKPAVSVAIQTPTTPTLSSTSTPRPK